MTQRNDPRGMAHPRRNTTNGSTQPADTSTGATSGGAEIGYVTPSGQFHASTGKPLHSAIKIAVTASSVGRPVRLATRNRVTGAVKKF
jgi:hypothetical protein